MNRASHLKLENAGTHARLVIDCTIGTSSIGRADTKQTLLAERIYCVRFLLRNGEARSLHC